MFCQNPNWSINFQPTLRQWVWRFPPRPFFIWRLEKLKPKPQVWCRWNFSNWWSPWGGLWNAWEVFFQTSKIWNFGCFFEGALITCRFFSMPSRNTSQKVDFFWGLGCDLANSKKMETQGVSMQLKLFVYTSLFKGHPHFTKCYSNGTWIKSQWFNHHGFILPACTHLKC